MAELYFFLQGYRDVEFFENVIFPLIENKFDFVGKYEYSNKLDQWNRINRYIKTINKMNNSYFLIEDNDNFKSVTKRILNISSQIKLIDKNKIIIAIEELEGWLLSGCKLKKLKIPHKTNFNSISKEQFWSLVEKSKIKDKELFIDELHETFDIKLAAKRNKSFKYFKQIVLD